MKKFLLLSLFLFISVLFLFGLPTNTFACAVGDEHCVNNTVYGCYRDTDGVNRWGNLIGRSGVNCGAYICTQNGNNASCIAPAPTPAPTAPPTPAPTPAPTAPPPTGSCSCYTCNGSSCILAGTTYSGTCGSNGLYNSSSCNSACSGDPPPTPPPSTPPPSTGYAFYGRVWQDSNNNGVYDQGGEGVNGINIKYAQTMSSGQVINYNQPTVDMSSFGYTYPGLWEGSYAYGGATDQPNHVLTLDTSTLPAGYSVSPSTPISVTSNPSSDTRIDWLIILSTYSIGGNVYVDTNGNGAKDPGETNSSGKTITVSGTGGGTRITDASGNYSFTGVASGSHTVTLTVPAGNSATTTNPSTVILGPSTTVNFGIRQLFSISGNVWVDANGNGAKDTGEVNSAGATVTLSGAGGGTRITDASGNYSFSSLTAGTRNVTLTVPGGYIATTTNPLSRTVEPNQSANFGIRQLFSISGNVFTDANKNQLLDIGEFDYSGGTSTINIYQGSQVSGSPYQTVTTNNGIFTTGNVLAEGTYTVSYTGLPTGYQMTFPVNGPPPQFIVTVGNPGCNTTGSGDASCDPINGNITNLNYGITNSIPWIQSIGGGDIGGDGGINTGGSGTTGGGGTGGTGATGGFNDPIPPGLTDSSVCGPGFASVPGSTSTTPGLIFTGNGSAYFGQGSASLKKWVVGATNFGPISQGGFVKTSYAYLQSIAKQANIPLTNLSTVCNVGLGSVCNLPSDLTHGIYIANGDLTLGNGTAGDNYTFPTNSNYIILVNGNLTIQTQLHVPVGSTALFSASGNITVGGSVGATGALGYQSSTSHIEGIFSADQSFIIDGQNDCTIGPDLKLNVAGSIITNAALNGGTFTNQRDLCANNVYCPVFTVTTRPDFILNAPDFIKKANYTWQELAP